MANVIIKDVGDSKVKVIKLYREITNLGLKEAKDAVDGVEAGQEIIISMEGAEQCVINKIIEEFAKVGAYAFEDKVYTGRNSFEKAMEISEETALKSNSTDGSKSEIFRKAPVNMGILGREDTLEKLIEIGKTAKELERLKISKGSVFAQRNKQKQEAENIRMFVPKNSKLWTGPLILMIISLIIGLVIPPILLFGVIIGLIWHSFKVKKYKRSYLLEHETENNQNAEAYIAEHVAPLENELVEIDNKIVYLYDSGKVAEAIDFVGEDLFAYECIEDLYNLIKSRRADNLKEALNLYDDTLHKARMEEMQAAIQNASEIAASESVKQTAYSKEIAKSSHQAATAAKATAYHTRKIDKNTRRFR